MKLKTLFFHIHYCNFRQPDKPGSLPIKINRTLQHHELIFIAKAKGSFTIDNKTHELKDGMLLYIRPDMPHALETDPGAPVSCFSVHFSYARVTIHESQWKIAEEPQALPLQAAQGLKDYYQIEDVFKKLAETWNAKLPGYEFAAKTLLQQLLTAIAQNMKKENQNFSISLKAEKIIQYMHEHIQDKITLAQLSDLVQLSPTYLSRAFKEITGYSIIEFFNKMKMDKAKEMILEGNRKIKEVAGALGYTDEFYFSRLFKKTEGISPSEYYSKNVHGV
ncbi:AraC family transcriptional regulator [Gordoniibacillus kamchatkensis]|uniref:AraC family transcriptional regulator n=1 Tax=Gordoniibacillus kamchatkensis TaxID=1590651 RepID=A0ABR5AJJ7_9BACL|nr:AraC family transcriptional regulator [Paenibacillus sp. VKM B-2647]KIL41219.1 AraC family transcriptional regulator [Paenibacillus sp. VKM B-2647]